AYDEALPVRGQLARQLLEEARPDRARAGEAHVAAEDVPELGQLVELHRPESPAEPRGFGARPLDELGAEVRAEPFLRARAGRPELEHLEDPAVLPDALAAVEDRPAARREDGQADQRDQRRGEEQEQRGEQDVERAQLEVDAPLRRAADYCRKALDERVARPRLRGAGRPRLRCGHVMMLEPRAEAGQSSPPLVL